MTKQLSKIDDPSELEKSTLTIDETVDLKDIKVMKSVKSSDGENITKPQQTPVENIEIASKETVKRLESKLNVQKFFDMTTKGIIQHLPNKIYYVGEENEKRHFGTVLQTVAKDSYAHITNGESIINMIDVSLNEEFEFVNENQVAIKTSKRQGRDFAIVAAKNGCILIDPGAYCLLDMPAIILEPTGDYYSVTTGKRKLYLAKGGHVILHVNGIPIIFVCFPVRAQTIDLLTQKMANVVIVKSLSKVQEKLPEPINVGIPKVSKEVTEEPTKVMTEDAAPKEVTSQELLPQEDSTQHVPVHERPPRDGFWYESAEKSKNEHLYLEKDRYDIPSEISQLPAPDIITSVLQPKEYEIGQYMGREAFGNVWTLTKGDEIKAVKAIIMEQLKPSEVKALHNEMEIWPKVKHENIIMCYDVVTDDHLIMYIMEYANDGDLIRDMHRHGCFYENDAKVLAHQICDALQHLHSNGIAHRDVKLDNISLINGIAKLSDFTVACHAIDSNGNVILDNTICGSFDYLSPETIERVKHDPRKRDIWAFGVTVFAMTTWMMPFGGLKDKGYDALQMLLKRQKSQMYQFPPEVEVSDDLKDMIGHIFTVDPNSRDDISQVLQYKWFQ